MARTSRIDTNLAGPVAIVSWPALCRPSMTGSAETAKVVDGRHKAGHDTVETTARPCPAKLAPMRTGRAMTVEVQPRPTVSKIGACGRDTPGHDDTETTSLRRNGTSFMLQPPAHTPPDRYRSAAVPA